MDNVYMNELIKKLNTAAKAYYTTGRSELSDKEYDELLEQLQIMEKETGIILSNSPSVNVGSEAVDNIRKVEHDHPMLSLGKVHDIEDVAKFIQAGDVLGMFKADGLTVSARYEDGRLVSLETRGNGYVGNDIMFHMNSFENLPIKIYASGTYVIDGEAVIKYDDFEEINKNLPEDQKYRNPRNLAAGTLNLLDPNISGKRHLRFYAWDVIEGGGDSLFQNLMEAKLLGFETVDFFLIKREEIQVERLKDFTDFVRKLSREEQFPIDGVVFKYDNLQYGKTLGSTEHHFNNAVAYKFEDDRFPTKMIGIDWQLGKTGQITPVLHFEPVEIDGTIVEKCSAHNLSILKQLHPTKNCTCYIYKANQIIPQCDGVEDDGDSEFDIPTVCPVCRAPVRIDNANGTEVLMCTNPECSGQLLGRMVHFVSKKGMDIQGLSEATLEKFIKFGWISTFNDIYTLDRYYSEMKSLDGFGEKSARKLLQSIADSRSVDLQHFITALSIPGIGEGQAKILCKRFQKWNEFVTAGTGKFDFTQLAGIGTVLNENIRDWFRTVYDKERISILAHEMKFKAGVLETKDQPLKGKTFVITGAVYHYKNRNELKNKIESLGGKVAGSVSGKTDFLINNDASSNSSKNIKAKQFDVRIITEEEFENLL